MGVELTETEGGILKLIGHDGNIIERTLGEDKVPLEEVCGMFRMLWDLLRNQ